MSIMDTFRDRSNIYFARSPFRSRDFVGSGLIIWGLFVWELVRAHHLAKDFGCLSEAVIIIAFTPIAVWAYSLYIHRTIGRLVADSREPGDLGMAARVHVNFPVTIALILAFVVQAIMYCHGR